METKQNVVLKHKSGLYLSRHAVNTKRLWDAWRFSDEESANVWLQNSIYAPQNADEYEVVRVTLTIEEDAANEHLSKVDRSA